MNSDTLAAVCCYAGDAGQVIRALPIYKRQGVPLVILSPKDSQVKIKGEDCQFAGRRAYIGELSLTRQLDYFRLLLEKFPQKYFLLHDSDSFCLSPELPERLYADETVVWSNEVGDPRPHISPYPKIAMQPSYFLSRWAMEHMWEVGHKISAHPVTPYVDWFMVAMMSEAGLKHRAFTELEHVPTTDREPPPPTAPWAQLAFRIRFCGTVFLHPIKAEDQFNLCVQTYEERIHNE